jgi:hypothetical protein
VTAARLAAAALALLSTSAWAKPGIGGAEPTFYSGEAPRHYESSQWFAFELKFGPYSPDIDSSPGLNGAKPFSDLFNPQGTVGRPKGQLLTQLEFDVQFLHKFGSLGVGASVGFYRRTTHAFQFDFNPATGTNNISCDAQAKQCVRSGDETALNVLPLALMLVYRFDVLALRYRVPLVPYLKIGIAYYIWWINNGGGFDSIATVNVSPGNSVGGWGGTFGWVLNPGLALLLDVFDPSAARTIDSELGINHTYVFAELNYANITGFGAPDKLVLSDLTWSCGLAFEF